MTIFATGEYSYRSGGGPGGAVHLPPSLLPSYLPHNLHLNSTYRTPFSRFSSRAHSTPLRSLRSPTPTPSLNYYRRAISAMDDSTERFNISTPKTPDPWKREPSRTVRSTKFSQNLNPGIQQYRPCRQIGEEVESTTTTSVQPFRDDKKEFKYSANYKTVLEEITHIQDKYKQSNQFKNKKVEKEYEYLCPDYKYKRDMSIFKPLSYDTNNSIHSREQSFTSKRTYPAGSPAQKKNDAKSRQLKNEWQPGKTDPIINPKTVEEQHISDKYMRYFREASVPSYKPTYASSVRSPSRYLAANLSTGIYSHKNRVKTLTDEETSEKASGYRSAHSSTVHNQHSTTVHNQHPSAVHVQPRQPFDSQPTKYQPPQAVIPAHHSSFAPREFSLAQSTYRYIQDYSIEKMKKGQGYGKPFFAAPFVLGI